MDKNNMKVEKSVSMYLHAFQQPCKHQIVTDPKSCNASHVNYFFLTSRLQKYCPVTLIFKIV